MKMKHFLPLVMLIAIFSLNSCTKDPCESVTCLNGGACIDGTCSCPEGYSGSRCETFDPCFNITCLNGGTCVNGQCNCPPAYTGSDCSQQVTPNQIRVTKIVLDEFPPLDNGSDWDGGICGGANPDIYITLDDGNGIFFSSGICSDLIPGNSCTYTGGLPVSSSNPNGTWVLRLYDRDTGACAPDDFMGGLQGPVYNSTNGFPSTVRFYNPSAEIDATFHFEYVF